MKTDTTPYYTEYGTLPNVSAVPIDAPQVPEYLTTAYSRILHYTNYASNNLGFNPVVSFKTPDGIFTFSLDGWTLGK